MKFELHCHSWHSHGSKIRWEGLASPVQIVKALKKLGFGGLAITDHDSVTGWHDAKGAAKRLGMVFIPGMEISTLSGHLIALGIGDPIKMGLSVRETIELVHDQGGITIAPHPLDVRGEGIGNDFVRADAVEIFNSMNLTRVENALAKMWAKKSAMPAVGGSDAHSLEMLGMTVNHINADDMDSALKMIKRGNVEIEGRYIPIPMVVAWVRQRMKMSYKDILKYIEKNYSSPRAVLARFLLRRFVNSESRAWNALGSFAVSVSTMYSVLRMLFR
jgi:predicted metal-dependent phosphoesterase TrpH